MKREVIPTPVVATVADVLGSHYYSHTKIDTLFMEAGAPGEPPPGNCVQKIQAWLKRANDDLSIPAPLQLLAELISPYMALERPEWPGWEEGAQRITRSLERAGLEYLGDGTIRSVSRTGYQLVNKTALRLNGERTAGVMANARDVFLVHGRDDAAREALCTFLTSLDLRPIEWEEMVRRTGKASPYVGEVLRAGFASTQATVVLMTGDDVSKLRDELIRPSDPTYEGTLTPQPRPNVLIEAGMALGIAEERTVLVEVGSLRVISDLVGRHTVRLSDTPESRKRLLERLRTAGCAVNDSGDRWLSAGAFGR